jgi:transcriptional regulator with XRE-family HTH domain
MQISAEKFMFVSTSITIVRLIGGQTNELKGVQPPADTLNKLAEIFNTSVDFLINGNTDEKAKATLQNTELLQRFKEVENLPERERSVILEVLSAYLRDFRTKQSYLF